MRTQPAALFPMPLVFNGLEVAAILLAALVANQVRQEAESTWIEGLQLLSVYTIMGLVFYFYEREDCVHAIWTHESTARRDALQRLPSDGHPSKPLRVEWLQEKPDAPQGE